MVRLLAPSLGVRRGEQYEKGKRELARRLGLMSEFWTMNSVLDRSSRPCHPPGYIATDDWYTCRRVRNALLAAAKA